MFLWITTIIVFLLDQTTKFIWKQGLHIVIIPSFFSLTTTTNKGIAFSLPLEGIALIVITICIIIAGGVYAIRFFDFSKRSTQYICGILLGGALGNLFDRIIYQYVIDFIKIGIFPVFNIADSAIFIGGIFLLLFYHKIQLKK